MNKLKLHGISTISGHPFYFPDNAVVRAANIFQQYLLNEGYQITDHDRNPLPFSDVGVISVSSTRNIYTKPEKDQLAGPKAFLVLCPYNALDSRLHLETLLAGTPESLGDLPEKLEKEMCRCIPITSIKFPEVDAPPNFSLADYNDGKKLLDFLHIKAQSSVRPAGRD